jgi:hypothetical protein
MDETAVAVRGGRHYLYRAVDRRGKSVASLLCNDRSMEAAQAFFRTAVSQDGVSWPQKINVDGNSATHRGPRLLGDEDGRWRSVVVRARRYLNNVVEQDHRAIKQRCAPMLGLKSFRSAAITLAGVELAHRFRKQQYSLPSGMKGRASSLKELWDAALADSGAPTCRDDDRRSTIANAPELSAPLSAAARAQSPQRTGTVPTHERFRSAETCTCSSGPKAGGIGTTTTDTAASGRRFRWAPIRTSRWPRRSRAIALRGDCSP